MKRFWAEKCKVAKRVFLILCLTAGYILELSSAAGGASEGELQAEGLQQDSITQTARISDSIKVNPTASDMAIDRRLTGILEATGWFTGVTVDVDKGIVFLDGRAGTKEARSWAGDMAGKIHDVAAVVNRIEVVERSPWDFSPVAAELENIWKAAMHNIPRFGLGLAVLFLVWECQGLFHAVFEISLSDASTRCFGN